MKSIFGTSRRYTSGSVAFVSCLMMFLLSNPIPLGAQVGGGAGYRVLDYTTNARTAALGGTTVSLNNGDVSQFFENPAVLDSVKPQTVFFNFNPFVAGITVFTGVYHFEMNTLGTLATGLQTINYGNFQGTDASGNSTGTFNALDYRMTVGKAHRVGPVTLGVNVSLVHSGIESYRSTAVSGDIGGTFQVNKNWVIGMVFRGIGGRLSNYSKHLNPAIPLDVKLGTSFRPEHMPLRFTLTTTNLTDKNVIRSTEDDPKATSGVEKVLRRVNVGAELLLSRHVNFLIGYSHKRKQELKLDQASGGSGFSWGLMIRIKRLEIRYSGMLFHVAGGTGFISLQTNFNDFKSIL